MSETQEQTVLTVVETLVPAKLFAPGNVEEMLTRIEDEVRKQAAELDISSAKARKEVASLAYKVAQSKSAMDAAGKKLTEQWRNQTTAVNAERKIIETRMDALKDEVRAPLTAWENKEKERVAAHELALADIVEGPDYGLTESVAELQARLVYLRAYPTRDWQEFEGKAAKTLAAEVTRTEELLIAAQAAADAAAERARLEAEEAEIQQAKAEEEKKAHEAKIAQDAAEQERVKAKQEAEAKAVKDEADRKAAAAKAEKDKQDAIDAAKRAAQKREYALSLIGHVKSCGLGFIGDQPQPYGLLFSELENKVKFTNEEFGDLLPEAIAAKDEALKRLRDGQEAQRKRHEEEQAAERVKVEDAARAENKAHRAAINNKIVSALSAIVPEAVAKEIIKAIVLGTVPHVKVQY